MSTDLTDHAKSSVSTSHRVSHLVCPHTSLIMQDLVHRTQAMLDTVQQPQDMPDMVQSNSTFNQTGSAKTSREDLQWDQISRVVTTTVAVYFVLCKA